MRHYHLKNQKLKRKIKLKTQQPEQQHGNQSSINYKDDKQLFQTSYYKQKLHLLKMFKIKKI